MRNGDVFISNQGVSWTVTSYVNAKCVHVASALGTEKVVPSYNLRTGAVKDSLLPTYYGVGYLGLGKYKTKVGGKLTKVFSTWRSMLTRCYCTEYQTKNPTYTGCVVAEVWHNFQAFASWFEANYRKDCDLDKDIIGNGKLYSPTTCCFVPRCINTLLNGNLASRGNNKQGVSWDVTCNRFKAQISVSCTSRHLGYFDSEQEAFEAYKVAKLEYVDEVIATYTEVLPANILEGLRRVVTNQLI